MYFVDSCWFIVHSSESVQLVSPGRTVVWLRQIQQFSQWCSLANLTYSDLPVLVTRERGGGRGVYCIRYHKKHNKDTIRLLDFISHQIVICLCGVAVAFVRRVRGWQRILSASLVTLIMFGSRWCVAPCGVLLLCVFRVWTDQNSANVLWIFEPLWLDICCSGFLSQVCSLICEDLLVQLD